MYVTYQGDNATAELLLGASFQVHMTQKLLLALEEFCGDGGVLVEY